MKKQILCLLLLLCTTLTFLPITTNAAEEVASGACGDNLTWVLDKEGLLTISGTGEMWDYEYKKAPWHNKSPLRSVIICEGVTNIGKSAFMDCDGLTSVTIPKSVTYFKSHVFADCFRLTSITIPDSVTDIGTYTFHSCSNLTDVQLSNSITQIGDYSFTDCTSLVSITIPGNVERIGSYAFFNCFYLKNVTLPVSVKNIVDSAFNFCSALTNVYYGGTEKQWNAITIGNYNYYLTNAKVHAWSDGVVTTAPTCTEKGEKTYTCTASGCGQTKVESIPAIGHSYTNYISDNNATCTKDGTKTAQCDNGCGIPSTVVDAGSKADGAHTPDGNTDCTKATCCTVCGDTIKPAGQHTWDEGTPVTVPTCTEKGASLFACQFCDANETRDVDALGHDLSYAADGAVITEICSRGDHSATATLSAENSTYNGKAAETATVVYSKGWQGGTLTIVYSDNINAGTASAAISVGDVTASVNFTIEKASTHTITLGNLNQHTNSLSAVTLVIDPADATAQVSVEYKTTSPAADCTHTHDEACGYQEAANCTHTHDEACGYAEEKTIWTAEMPTVAGSYPVRAWLTASDNITVPEETVYTTGTLTISAPYYGGGGGMSRPSTTTPSESTETKEDATKEDTTKQDSSEASKKFTDVADGAWYSEAVYYAFRNGLMNGTFDTQFSPDGNVTRAMVMTVLARLAGEDTSGGVTWYENGMAWAIKNGISDGINPEANITREQLVTMLHRYLMAPAASGNLNKFQDSSSVSSYAQDAMTWATVNGIVNGMTENTLTPKSFATRAQFAAILMRFCEMTK